MDSAPTRSITLTALEEEHDLAKGMAFRNGLTLQQIGSYMIWLLSTGSQESENFIRKAKEHSNSRQKAYVDGKINQQSTVRMNSQKIYEMLERET